MSKVDKIAIRLNNVYNDKKLTNAERIDKYEKLQTKFLKHDNRTKL